jgi:hypothetical protein
MTDISKEVFLNIAKVVLNRYSGPGLTPDQSKECYKGLDACQEWTGGKSSRGYGVAWVKGRIVSAHRLSYMVHNGEIAEGEFILHRCDNRSCINPKHLLAGDAKANSLDMVTKGREAKGEANGASTCPEHVLRGEGIGNSKLTEGNIVEIRARYAAGGITQEMLGVEFGVSQVLIGLIVRRKIWKHIPADWI